MAQDFFVWTEVINLSYIKLIYFVKEIFTMKKLIICLSVFLLVIWYVAIVVGPVFALATTDDPAPAYRVTNTRSEEDEQWLWETINKYSPSEELTAGIMGFFYRESGFKSNAVPGYQLWISRDICQEFTDAIDAGLSDGSTKEQFIEQAHNKGGYGLGQWWAFSYLEAFYDFAQDWGTSISDAEMQCAFVIWSIENQRPEVLTELAKYQDAYGLVHRAGRIVAGFYDGAPNSAGMFGDLAVSYYDKYASQ